MNLELIDTQWDVNEEYKEITGDDYTELIDTQWDVNDKIEKEDQTPYVN